jgi:tRNA-dihydrouridine synthase
MIYSGPVAFPVIRAVREALRIPVIANGGVFHRSDAERLRRETGCSRIMVARGAIGNPWIFRELGHVAGRSQPSHEELCGTLETHVLAMAEFYGENLGLRCARKIMHGYLHGRGYRHALKAQVSHLATVPQFADFMTRLRDETPAPVTGQPAQLL